MPEYMPQEGKVLGVVLSSHQDDSPDLLTARQTLFEVSAWTNIVSRIRAGDSTASGELYPKVLRWLEYSCRSWFVEEDSEDCVQDTYLAVLKAIRTGELREPEKLLGLIQVIGHRHYCAYVKRRDKSGSSQADHEVFECSYRSTGGPEHGVRNERPGLAQAVFAQLAPREQEILERFYIREESPDSICETMSLTDNQFRLLKRRAKAKVTLAAK
jgi:RNA polymerase sigma-70 factor, ECF subfamily